MLTDTLTALHRAIVETPDDLDLRLVYADCLEENGEADRADFIRVQIERCTYQLTEPHRVCHHDTPKFGCCCRCRLCWLREREREVEWITHYSPYVLGLIVVDDYEFRRGFVEAVTVDCADWLVHGAALVRALVEGDDTARGPLSDWLLQHERVSRVLHAFRPLYGNGAACTEIPIRGCSWSCNSSL